ncbi:hypothetical protein EDB84DRAFT_593596 [Lactarius hengduanensis]|nr:hypothetical protein EDB84DRAFT_593596 [Lactarius hengduanensis]
MGPRMSDPLRPAVRHLRHDTRRLVEQYVIPCSRESNEWSVAVREKVDFLVDTDDEMLVTSSATRTLTRLMRASCLWRQLLGKYDPRHTPDHVIELLPTAMFKEWRSAESDQRCPICLDDYQEDDSVMKLSDCSHWLHKNCLQQWLRGATTCPVCRQRVRGPQPGRREREARAVPSSSRGIERSELDITREIQEHVRLAFPDIAAAVRAEAGPSSSGSEAERDVEQEDGDMALEDWGGIANAI